MFAKLLQYRHSLGAALAAAMLCGTTPAHAAMEVKTARIAHGVSVWYAPSSAVPVVDIQITYQGAGYASDPAGQEGRAALAAYMLTQGAGELDALAFQKALDDGAIQLSAHSDADRLTIHIHALRDQAKRAGELVAMALSKPRLDTADIARIKTRMHTQLAQLNESPAYHASRLFAGKAFPNHPYANAPLGTDAGIDAVTADNLRNYFSTYATRVNLRIAAAGDVDDALLQSVAKPIIAASGDSDAAAAIAPVNMQGGNTTVRETLPVPQTVVQFAAPAVARNDPKFYAAYLLNHILGGHDLTSRLMQAVRQEKGLAYGVSTDLEVRTGTSLLRGELATRNATAEQAISAVKATLGEMHDKGVSTQECKDAKAYIIGSKTIELDNSTAISGMLMSMQIHQLGEDYLDKRTAYFSNVSCADITAAARELLDPSRFLFTVVGGAPEAAPEVSAAMGVSDAQHRRNAVDFLRFLAATMVWYSHCFALYDLPSDGLDRLIHFHSFGSLGVTIFFVISGYFITASFHRSNNLRTYALHRALRIFPALLVLVLLTLFILGPLFTQLNMADYFAQKKTWGYLRTIFIFPMEYYLPAVFADHPNHAVNGSLWSLQHEVRCYIIIAVLGILGGLRLRTMLALLAALLLVRFYGAVTLPDDADRLLGMRWSKLEPAVRLGSEFALGASLYLLRAPWRWWIAVVAGGFAVLGVWVDGHWGHVVFDTGFAYVLLYVGLKPLPVLRHFGRYGDFSYGFYLYAYPMQQVAYALYPSTNFSAFMVVSFLFSIGCAMTSWYLVEQPALRYKARLIPRLTKPLASSL